MKRCPRTRYGISIQADDPKFDEKSVRDLLRRLGGKEIAEVHFDLEDLDSRP